jgi:hypothetical protein
MNHKQAFLILTLIGILFGSSSILPSINPSLPLISVNNNIIQLITNDAEIQAHSYKENFNDYGDAFTNTSGFVNVTDGIGLRAGGLQLNYSYSTIEKRALPPDKDNWTEDPTWVPNWAVITDPLLGVWIDKWRVVNNWSLAMNYTEICDGFAIHEFTNLTGTWNLTGYDIMNWWYFYIKEFEYCPDMLLVNVTLWDSSGNSSTYTVNQYIPPLTWIHFSLNMTGFIPTIGFNISDVQTIHWLYTYVPYCEIQWYTVFYDGLHFVDYEQILTIKDRGVWYSDWITPPGANMLWTELIIETTHPTNTTIEVSIDNSTFFPISSVSPNIAQYLVSSPVIIRITLEKTSSVGSPFVDYLILVAEPILVQLLELFPFLIPTEPDLLPWVLFIVASGGAAILAVLLIRQLRIRIIRLKY